MVGRATWNIYSGSETFSWFFHDDKAAVIVWKPGTTEKDVLFNTSIHSIKDMPLLKGTGFKKVDAILPAPSDPHRAYVFCDDQYALIKGGGLWPESATIVVPPGKISKGWPSLVQAGFDRVDGALRVPGSSNEAYIFSRSKYCRISFTEGEVNDRLVDGPYGIREGWAATGFSEFENIFPNPEEKEYAYVFCEDHYIQIEVNSGGQAKATYKPREVGGYWPALKKAGFY